MEYINEREEEEVWVNVDDLKIIDVMNINDMDKAIDYDMLDLDLYYYYAGLLRGFSEMYSGITREHGTNHVLRVMFNALMIGKKLGFSDDELEKVAVAAILHDIGRDNDLEDESHGEKSYNVACQNNFFNIECLDEKHNQEICKFLLEFHCKDDELAKIYANKYFGYESDEILKLLFLLKDADALDRLRFGMSDLDIRYLRFKESISGIMYSKNCIKFLKI